MLTLALVLASSSSSSMLIFRLLAFAGAPESIIGFSPAAVDIGGLELGSGAGALVPACDVVPAELRQRLLVNQSSDMRFFFPAVAPASGGGDVGPGFALSDWVRKGLGRGTGAAMSFGCAGSGRLEAEMPALALLAAGASPCEEEVAAIGGEALKSLSTARTFSNPS